MRVDFHPKKTAFLPRVFPLASAGGRMIEWKSPWSSLILGAVLACYKSCGVVSDSP